MSSTDYESKYREALDLLRDAEEHIWGEVPMSDLAEAVTAFLKAEGEPGATGRYGPTGNKTVYRPDFAKAQAVQNP